MSVPETREARRLLDLFNGDVLALIQYGSTVFGQQRTGSASDFWVICADLARFHHLPAVRRLHDRRDNLSLAQHIRMNRSGPNFYAIEEEGMRIKIAVIDRDTFARLCRAETYFVKGRMQKPVRVVRSCPEVEEAILAARRDGVLAALNLLERDFTFHRFLEKLLGLSYRAEIRPEMRRKKIASILRTGEAELEAIYRPLLEERPEVRHVGPDAYVDTRPDHAKRRAHRLTRRRIRRQKYSREHLQTIWKNYRTHAAPLRYMYDKLLGELEKFIHGLRQHPPENGAGANGNGNG